MATWKSIIRKAFSSMLFPFAAAYTRTRPGIRILMYHRVDRLPCYDQLTVSPERFERHMAYLATHQRVISLTQALAELASTGKMRSAVAVTFDDGYRDNLLYALPILERYKIPATIFITTQFCDQTHRHPRYAHTVQALHLTWEEARDLSRKHGITLGSHSVSHPYLSRLSDQQAELEISESRRLVQQHTGSAADFFCYPSGDYGSRESGYVKQAGYLGAVTVAPGVNRKTTPLHELRRTEITQNDSVADLKAKLSGAFDLVHMMLHLRRRRAFARRRKPSA